VTPGRDAGKKKSGAGLVVLLIVILLVAVGTIVWAFLDTGPPWDAPPQIKATENPVPATPETLAAAKVIYQLRCAHCHGNNGDGDGPEAHRLRVEPTDFTDVGQMSRLTDGEIFWRIGAGRRPMPSFRDKLTETERWELVDYIRAFAQPLPKTH